MLKLGRHLLLLGLLGLAACTATPPPAAPDPELLFWDSIKESRNPAEYQAYLDAYPHGRFAGLARLRVDVLTPKVVMSPPRKPAQKPAPKPPVEQQKPVPPSEQQGEPSITDAPAPPVTWAKVEGLSGAADPRVRSRIMECWVPPPLPRGGPSLRAEIAVYFDDAGKVIGTAFSDGNGDMADATYHGFVESALAAPMKPDCRTLDLPAGTPAGSLSLLFGLDSPP